MVKISCSKGFQAKEWNSKAGDKHNVYVKSSDGDIGWLDLATAKFHNKSDSNFGFVGEAEAIITITGKETTVYLGFLDSDIIEDKVDKYRESLKDAVMKLGSMKFDGMDLEINIGPSREIRQNGKSGWAKANLTVRVSNPDDIEGLYDSVSDLAAAMLDIETERLLNRQS